MSRQFLLRPLNSIAVMMIGCRQAANERKPRCSDEKLTELIPAPASAAVVVAVDLRNTPRAGRPLAYAVCG